ncbi:MAG: hypothetical protein R2857_08045 [Vampirovibrionales bacterium]
MQPVSFSPVSPRLAGHSLQAVPLSQPPQGGKSRQPATGYAGYAGDAPLSAQVAFGGWDRLWRWIPGLGGSSEKPASDDGLQPAKPHPFRQIRPSRQALRQRNWLSRNVREPNGFSSSV